MTSSRSLKNVPQIQKGIALLLAFPNADVVKLDEASAAIQKYEDMMNSKPQISLRKYIANSLVRLLTEIARFDAKGVFTFDFHSSIEYATHF